MLTLHHLNQSRSKRIIWMLEELGVEYQIKAYQRDAKTFLAPVELKAIHPLGKSPVIENNDLVLAESGAIIEYLIEKFDAKEVFAPAKNSKEYAHYLQWLHFAESSAAFPLLMDYFLKKDASQSEFLNGYVAMELEKILSYLSDHLQQQPWLTGQQFTGADVLISFIFEIASSMGLLADYPVLQDYLARLKLRPAAIKAEQIEAEH
ncbi:glutathione S-transferase family protein [Pelagibaculum spongiae]|uniref:glutathione transferase n=1 Tax=Pelagibaculum spongiae TaxID=2080658 RepID=A0A2V1H4B5_9GAMM|nr:glutathione S-transferase [Pelagibaculum spongiae]PVZ70476.1 glutathione S-transferase [Pelagibaculum spongiae]